MHMRTSGATASWDRAKCLTCSTLVNMLTGEQTLREEGQRAHKASRPLVLHTHTHFRSSICRKHPPRDEKASVKIFFGKREKPGKLTARPLKASTLVRHMM